MHVAFINMWSFWNGFWTLLGFFSPWRFTKWILSIVPNLFSYCLSLYAPQIARVFGVVHLLTMTKPLGGIHPIVVGETLYRFTSDILCTQFCEIFATHFSPHQFRVATKGGYETIIHDIRCTLDLHLNWVIL
jgi:hypothetical protein